jgi:hypothetical protein
MHSITHSSEFASVFEIEFGDCKITNSTGF